MNSLDKSTSCDHQWRPAGLWDGKDPITLQRTGGMWLKCDLCGKRVNTKSEAQNLGGTFVENTDIYGRPTS